MKILVEFILFGDDFPVDEVATNIGIENCEIGHVGEPVYGGPGKKFFIRNEDCSWIQYSTGYVETIYTEIPLKMMHDVLYKKKDIIRKAIEQYSLTSKFCIVLCLSDNPAIGIQQEMVELAAYLKAHFEFDTTMDYDEEERPVLGGNTCESA